MTSGSEADTDEETSRSWPDTEFGLLEQPPESPPLATRRTFSHYTQVRHNGYLTKRFKLLGSSSPWSQQFCTVHGNILRCYAGKRQFTDSEGPVETNIIRRVRPWEAEFTKPYNRGLLIDCEGGETIIARTNTSAEQEEWMEALRTVTELLGNSTVAGFGGEDSDNGDDEFDVEGRTMQTTYLKQKEALLSIAEATGPCTVVFQVAKTTLKRVDEVDVGRFNNGDVYLVMHAAYGIAADPGAAKELTRTLFYWVGSRASMDKGTVACIKAVELRRALTGPCQIRREDEGQESPEFLVLFDEVTVAEDESGARVLSKVKKWNEQPPIMYSVRMRSSATRAADGIEEEGTALKNTRSVLSPRKPLHSSFTVGRIDLDEDQLGSERVLLVDDRNGHVYLWCGNMSTFKHRGFGLEAATRLKADSPKGGQVVQVDEDDEPPELRRILDRARKQRLLELQVRAAEGDDNGAEEEGAEQRRMSLMGASAEGAGPAVSLFRVTQAEGSLQLSLVACTSREYIAEIGGDELEPEQDGSPMLSMLEGDAAFILDVFTEVFVWYGDEAPRTVRIGAGKVAHQLVHAVARPAWAEEITHVREVREPFLFRVKFFDWGVSPRGQVKGPVNDISSFHKAVRTIAEVRHNPEKIVRARATETLRRGMGVDLPSPADTVVAAAGAGEDEGYGELLMWRVHPRGLIAVPEEEFGHMHSSHSYVFLYGYDGTGYVDDDESNTEDEHDGSDDQDDGNEVEAEDSGDDGVELEEYDSDEVTDSGSSENDSVLAGIDARGNLSDDDEYNAAGAGGIQRGSARNTLSSSSSRPRSHGRRATRGETLPKAGGKSRRKTMFEEMRRESLAGCLQPVGRNGQRQRRLSNEGEESLEKMALLSEEEEEDGVERERERRKTMGRLRSSNYQGRGGIEQEVEETSDGPLEVSAESDEYDHDEEDGDEEENDDGDEKGGADPRFLIYFWAGARAKKSDWVLWKLELAKTMIPEWQKVIDAEIPQIQVAQGQEPLHFRRLFGQGRDHGRLIVHDRVWRKRDNPEKRVSLFKVQRLSHGEFQAFQVPPTVGSLNSMDVFVCICTVVTDDWVGNNDEAVYFWVGKHSTLTLQEHGAKVLMALLEYYCMPADFKVQILEEDELYEQHAQLWDELSEILGGEVSWAHWNDVFEDDFEADDDLGCVSKMYVAEASSGDVELAYLGYTQRKSLIPETIAVLDTDEGVYLWRGAKVDVSQLRIIQKACDEYCKDKPLAVGRRVIPVQDGHELPIFRARFQAWDDGGSGEDKKFEDVYEKRVVQLTQEGKLGDMSALRGRVLEDDEAAKYWDRRGAEPGGQGMGTGIFRDDPASRSTQRRGAPGRKAWVKPPAKPKPDPNKAKELESKRNFLALKDRFEGRGDGEAFWGNAPKKTFSRQSLLQARQQSIAMGHATKFEEVPQQRHSMVANSAVRQRSTRSPNHDAGGGDQNNGSRRESADPVEGESKMGRRSSWESSSSARRRHAASVEAEAQVTRARKSAEATAAAAAAEADPSWRPRLSAGRRLSHDSTAGSGWDADGSVHGGWVRRGSSGSLSSSPVPSASAAATAAVGTGARDAEQLPNSLETSLPGEAAAVPRPSVNSPGDSAPTPSVRGSSPSRAERLSDWRDTGEEGTAVGAEVQEKQEGRGGKADGTVEVSSTNAGIVTEKPPKTPMGAPRGREETARSRWRSYNGSSTSAIDRNSFEARAMPPRVESRAGSSARSSAETGHRRRRSKSGSVVVDNEGLLEALEQAEQAERRRTSMTPCSSSRASGASMRTSWPDSSLDGSAGGGDSTGLKVNNGKTTSRLSKSGRLSVGGESLGGSRGRGSGSHESERAASAYGRALAKVRRETMEEGMRQGQTRERGGPGRHHDDSDRERVSLDEEEGRSSKPPVSLKHAMSRVKDQSQPPLPKQHATTSTSPRALSGALPTNSRRAVDRSHSAMISGRLSIDSVASFNEEESDRDADSPRNRGRQYDDRWKVPGHAESVLASFVERLEHRGHHGHVLDGGVDREASAAAALEEARADREAAIALLNSNGRGGNDRLARGCATPTAIATAVGVGGASRPAQESSNSKKRRSNGGGMSGGKASGRIREGARSKRIDSRGKMDDSPRRTAERFVAGNGGAWSRLGGVIQSFQRAAEAITGVQKEEEGRRDEGVDIEKTREVVTAFLSSRGAPRRDQE